MNWTLSGTSGAGGYPECGGRESNLPLTFPSAVGDPDLTGSRTDWEPLKHWRQTRVSAWRQQAYQTDYSQKRILRNLSATVGDAFGMLSKKSGWGIYSPGLFLTFLAVLTLASCGRNAGPSSTQNDGSHATEAARTSAKNKPGTPGYIPPAESQVFVVNGQIDLVALTAALRDYCRWKMRVPKDLNELVTSRYLTNLPAPPAGQKYSIDPTYLEVTLVNQ